MNYWDYVLIEDILQMTHEEFNSFRNYLKIVGHNIGHRYGDYYEERDDLVILWHDGDLVWADYDCAEFHSGSRVPLEEVKRMAALGALV